MNTQNTPVHIKLWHRDFWLMSLASLLLTAAVYMQIPLLPTWMLGSADFSHEAVGVSMGVSGIGVFSLGCFCSYLVQRYRRNKVCIAAILVVALCSCAFCYFQEDNIMLAGGVVVISALRFVQSAAFGLAQMVLSSTLIVDTCESFRRTEANHSAAWFSRFALVLGPAVVLATMPLCGFNTLMMVSALLCLLSIAFILAVKFPFKAPDDLNCKISTDRFFLSQGKWLFVNLLLFAVVIGMVLSSCNTLEFYGMMTIGFFLALLAQRFVFVNAELKSEVTTGIILVLASVLINFANVKNASDLISPVLMGCGIGITCARFLLLFLKLSDHCQRGTSQSTFFLSWESGLSFGLFVGYFFFYADNHALYMASILLLCIALIMYVTFTHGWYVRNKNR